MQLIAQVGEPRYRGQGECATAGRGSGAIINRVLRGQNDSCMPRRAAAAGATRG